MDIESVLRWDSAWAEPREERPLCFEDFLTARIYLQSLQAGPSREDLLQAALLEQYSAVPPPSRAGLSSAELREMTRATLARLREIVAEQDPPDPLE